MIFPMIIALSLNPLSPVVPPVATETKAKEVVQETVVLDNFNNGGVKIELPTAEGKSQATKEQGLAGVLGGVRYVSVNVDGCDKDPLYCNDTRINSRKSGVLSVANSQLANKSVVEIMYEVEIQDLREYSLAIKDLQMDETAKKYLKVFVVANGVEYEVNKDTLTYDFYGIPGGDAININLFTVKFVSEHADDFIVDELSFTRTKTIEPKPVPAFGFNPVPFLPLGALAFLGGGGDSQQAPMESILVDNIPPEVKETFPPTDIVPEVKETFPPQPVTEPKAILGTFLLSVALILKKII